jgi:endonuclease YncB( thermonuclease family)
MKPLTQDKYGRWLAMVTPITTSTSVNDALVVAGLARPYFGGKKPT